jgi:uncharacterized SAM-binding protein YcdF (DUF218 family)
MLSIWTLIFALLAVCAGGSMSAYRRLGRWLLIKDRLPEAIDLIFVFGGEETRKGYSAELANRFPESRLIVSHHNRPRALRQFDKMGIDSSRIIAVVDTCTSTFSEISYLADFLAGAAVPPDPHIALVSSPYHMRRIRIIAGSLLADTRARCYLLPVPFERYQMDTHAYDRWWESPVRKTVVLEYQKMVHDIYRSMIGARPLVK